MSAKSSLPRAPQHLSNEARRWWKQVVSSYELAEHHLRVLRLACESWDRCQGARTQLATEGVTYQDRFGAPRVHPAVAIERDSRLAFARLLRELDLEGEPHPGYRR